MKGEETRENQTSVRLPGSSRFSSARHSLKRHARGADSVRPYSEAIEYARTRPTTRAPEPSSFSTSKRPGLAARPVTATRVAWISAVGLDARASATVAEGWARASSALNGWSRREALASQLGRGGICSPPPAARCFFTAAASKVDPSSEKNFSALRRRTGPRRLTRGRSRLSTRCSHSRLLPAYHSPQSPWAVSSHGCTRRATLVDWAAAAGAAG